MNSPSDRTLGWATDALGAGVTIESITGLRDGRNPWLLRPALVPAADGATVRSAVLKTIRPGEHQQLATQIAALSFANEHQLPAPELIAYDTAGDVAGVPAVLVTVLEGSSTIPFEASAERLRQLGATAAALHRLPAPVSADLPLRTRPIPLEDFAEQRRRTGVSTPLLRRADALAAEWSAQWTPEESRTVFVHGDFWQGNLLWSGDRLVGIVDWDCAGIGHYGVDLGSARLDAALMFGCPSADAVLRGWEQTIGQPARDLAWSDLIAAVNQPTDMAEFVPTIQDQGRTDLTAELLNARREEFLTAAVDRLSDRAAERSVG